MYRVRHEELPFVGSSHEFVGTEQGDVGVSGFLFSGLPGKGPGPPGAAPYGPQGAGLDFLSSSRQSHPPPLPRGKQTT
jgi:hypothetical protein